MELLYSESNTLTRREMRPVKALLKQKLVSEKFARWLWVSGATSRCKGKGGRKEDVLVSLWVEKFQRK